MEKIRTISSECATILDESGNVKSALYGKISGPILCGAQGYIQFTYYLNPTRTTGTWNSIRTKTSSRTSPIDPASQSSLKFLLFFSFSRMHFSGYGAVILNAGQTSDWREEVGLCSSTAREGERRGHARVQCARGKCTSRSKLYALPLRLPPLLNPSSPL
jgi:hypothetical protein